MLRIATSAIVTLALSSIASAQCEYVNEDFNTIQPGAPVGVLNNWTTTGVVIVGLYPTGGSPSLQTDTQAISTASYSLVGAGVPSVFSLTFDVDTGINSSFGLGCPGTPAGRALVSFNQATGLITSLEPGGLSTALNPGTNSMQVDVDVAGTYQVIANGVTLISGPWTASGLPACPAPDELLFANTETAVFGLAPMFVDNICLGDVPLGFTSYCAGQTPNSTGVVGLMSASGSNDASLNDLTVTASNLPVNQFGMFLASPVQVAIPILPVGNAFLCLNPNVGGFARLDTPLLYSGANGQFSRAIDLTMIPGSGGTYAVMAGDTLNFQAWHRDVAPTTGAHLTDAISITFN